MINFLLAQLWFSSLDFFSSHSCRLHRNFFEFLCLSFRVVLFLRTKVGLSKSKFSKYIQRSRKRIFQSNVDNLHRQFLGKLCSALQIFFKFSRVILRVNLTLLIGNFLVQTWSSSYEFFCHKCDSLHLNFSRAQQSSSQEFSALYWPSTREIFYGRSVPLYRNKCCQKSKFSRSIKFSRNGIYLSNVYPLSIGNFLEHIHGKF